MRPFEVLSNRYQQNLQVITDVVLLESSPAASYGFLPHGKHPELIVMFVHNGKWYIGLP